MHRQIPVAAPVLAGNEESYVIDCLKSGWISSNGSYTERFERAFADFIGVKHGIACCNGTAALHLALLGASIGEGDEVIVPTLTFVAVANAVRYCNATPVFVDCEPETWNIDPVRVEAAITERTKAIIVAHLYGHPARMDRIQEIAERHKLRVIEDAAEAHGSEFEGKKCGSLGELATFSFYGNKAVTTGEGGMVLTDDDSMASKIRQLKGQGQDPSRRYWFPIVGYNYRMTNICAAIGLAQTEKIDWHIERRRTVSLWYKERLKEIQLISWQHEASWAKHSYWMFTVLLDGATEAERDQVVVRLAEDGIETRPVFYPMHTLPPYQSFMGAFPVAERLAATGINLPTWAGLSQDDVDLVCARLKMHTQHLGSHAPAPVP